MSEPILPPTRANSCALIITYNADSEFFERLKRISAQFSSVVIVDNGSTQGFQRQLQQYCQKTTPTTLTIIQNASNKGIATALNQGFKFALAQQSTWVISFDQDTLVYPELLPELSAIYDQNTLKPVIIGCNYFHEAFNRPAIIPQAQQKYVARKTLITSGTLILAKLPTLIGFFREDYFIDSVDHEFSLRARQHGYALWVSTKMLMRHTIGRSTTFHRPALFQIPEHSALRKYYITRNCLVTVFNYYRQEPLWCGKQLVRLTVEFLTVMFYEAAKTQKIAAMGLGTIHACTGKMGELKNNAWIGENHDR
ncbi:MAG: glycosyltransferase [Methylococcaceae bacterium]|nr:glycosyltransferase [Methylococcaceae bacterium]